MALWEWCSRESQQCDREDWLKRKTSHEVNLCCENGFTCKNVHRTKSIFQCFGEKWSNWSCQKLHSFHSWDPKINYFIGFSTLYLWLWIDWWLFLCISIRQGKIRFTWLFSTLCQLWRRHRWSSWQSQRWRHQRFRWENWRGRAMKDPCFQYCAKT